MTLPQLSIKRPVLATVMNLVIVLIGLMAGTILLLSNGHGEDEVAARLARALADLRPDLTLLAFPPVAIELYHGNIHLLIAVAIVLGFRFPAAWAFRSGAACSSASSSACRSPWPRRCGS